jgi:hypothetical protein
MLPQKFRHIFGCLAFSEFVLAKKVTLPWLNHILKIQWEIHFLRAIFIEKKNTKIFFRIIII